MMAKFHDKEFDSETLLKLDIFRGYIRQWLPVFLSKTSYTRVNIYDFFAGPGHDLRGREGSPLIIIGEVERYLLDPVTPKGEGITMTLYFNDIDHDNMEELSAEIRRRQKRGRYDVCFQSKAFADAFAEELPIMQKQESANLVILDQCGIKEINGGIFSQLVHSPTTDILFFISTTAIRRFISEDVIQRHFPIPADEIRNVPLYQIHRFICSYYYEKLIPPGKKYYLAPFSIRKGNQPNIYGIIFGSGSLLGLEKFLDVCWSIDPVTGEANYNIDQDTIREGQLSIFEEENVIRKQDQFEKDTEALLASQITDNRPLYRFCLENGFRPTHLVTILRNLQRSGKLQVTDPKTGELLRKGTFHISWEKYAVGHPSALFEYLGESK